ncbi:hypothetical protein FJV76_16030 [Mesorhizobium sp. WSM4303]|uniref:hypothetical protein n=1 Tax=unclassified Mesorhizobium TaxID=325217 RepID=UPI00115DACF4|nr:MULTISPECIES: hypothetical protein [unclassified Mesorhizobium]TRC92587.1 hypothetical protein FJV77_24780 [Mesorhizobium sp. WSM4306]TRD03566.1 hypothetical protein FJV76_16030 [Mesorhizobium sp. WSM4303]
MPTVLSSVRKLRQRSPPYSLLWRVFLQKDRGVDYDWRWWGKGQVFDDLDETAGTCARNRANHKHSEKAHAQIAPQAGREDALDLVKKQLID